MISNTKLCKKKKPLEQRNALIYQSSSQTKSGLLLKNLHQGKADPFWVFQITVISINKYIRVHKRVKIVLAKRIQNNYNNKS